MKASGFCRIPQKGALSPLKKVFRFLLNICNKILLRIRAFAWRKLIPWCALLLGICLFFMASVLSISAAVKHKTAPRIITPEALVDAGEHFDLILVLGALCAQTERSAICSRTALKQAYLYLRRVLPITS